MSLSIRPLAWFSSGSFLALSIGFSGLTANEIETTSDVDSSQPAIEQAEQKTRAGAKTRVKSADLPAVEVEMFSAIEEGLLQVDYIARDMTKANIIFRNQSDKPILVKLPDTFGAVPVLAQGMMGGMGGMGGGGMGGGGMGGGGGQGMGGGMGGMGGGGMGGGMMGGGMMRVETDKPRKAMVDTVCLEHGKPNPTPKMKYKIVRLEEVNPDPQVGEVCKMLGYGQVSQNIAQAAAWHLTNDFSWEQIMQLPKHVSQYTGIELFFSPQEVQSAMRLVSIAASNVDTDVEPYYNSYSSSSSSSSASSSSSSASSSAGN